jgi:hypothetical protein
MARNLKLIPMYRRWDDLYTFVGTPLEKQAFDFMREQIILDLQSKTPSLLAKWLKSLNTSSKASRELAEKTRKAFELTHREYRKALSLLRERINVLERLMSAGKWEEIEFSKIPSRAGLIYKNAFARHDIERMKAEKEVQSYADFAQDKTKTVNAKTLYPYECVAKALAVRNGDATDRAIVNKYWDNLADYIQNASFNGLAVVDTSASMTWGGGTPINVAISLGMYCAEKVQGPFAGHYVSFSSRPQLIKVDGIDFVDKVKRIYKTNLCENTNIEATFDLLLNTALRNGCKQDEIPQNLIIISDLEFDAARGSGWGYHNTPTATLMENIEKKWNQAGYKTPSLIFWNVNARNDNIPMKVKNGISFVSGFSPTIFQQIMTGKTAFDLMYDVLNQERYKDIH